MRRATALPEYVCTHIGATAMDQLDDTKRLEELRELFLRHFAVGAPGSVTAKQMTTSDLFAIIDQHAPNHFEAGMLFEVLRTSGFQDRLVGDELTWCVQPR